MKTTPPFGTGSFESLIDTRTFAHPTDTRVTPSDIGYDYDSSQIEHQHYVGICTAISLVQNAEKALNKKFSPDFQYLLQKKFIDMNWDEGSSIFSSLKVGKTYGFLPIELFTYVTEYDRNSLYYRYIDKLKAIPDSEILRLINLCVSPLKAYASVKIDVESIAHAIGTSKSGILVRYVIDSNWWYPSWRESDINPLKSPISQTSGHAIIGAKINGSNIELANTWGTLWNRQGKGNAIFDNYMPTEAWIPYYTDVPIEIETSLVNKTILKLINTLKFGDKGIEVKRLQQLLIDTGYKIPAGSTGFYGSQTLAAVASWKLKNK